ncbi:hypothetical protein HUB98_24220 [Paenibacillus barcinonensis]|uniref:Uncharacterized protein n=1 Tax=Paenibacillus barcinonensis TaxID=198119 RepID=A0A2V4UYX0_PAEBA|nr:hypothetical protein [Paenibacillus barcinonensis]PYE41666.1 hypothetical protein DFQ00_1581 [Paenibacillus barcinonensis]QKS59007.1 hypothetical protein HUB98_24220 [Paenibacillus barcinonensis]
MKKEQAIQKFERQIALADDLKASESFSPEFKKWQRDTEIIITKVFGEDTRHIKDFDDISYSLGIFSTGTPDSAFVEAYLEGLEEAKSILLSFIQEINEFWTEVLEPKEDNLEIEKIQNLCNRFHLISRQIRSRHANRETLNIEDEYDVQDLFHALLTLYFDDIRPEEWTPSYAGSGSRVDFLLKQENIIIEIKKTRKGLVAKEVGEQLMIDILRYQAHPNCKTLICFVYDPEGRIGNPKGIENDLSKTHEGIDVQVIITPRGL